MNTAGRIVLLRNRIGLNQKAFAELIGRSSGYLNRIENGKDAPTLPLVTRISETFGISKEWLEEGKGTLAVESIGERIRRARKARDYTQEELSLELGVSRNAVGMMERGSIRPSEENLDKLCSKLWINKHWLLTGQGNMEKMELTPFYELLRRDPEVREHIRSFIDHLDKPCYSRDTEEDEREEEQEETVMVPARVNDPEAARIFFRLYNIPFEEKEDGKVLLVRRPREIDGARLLEAEERCRKARIYEITDHAQEFRDAEDHTIVTFSPYNVKETSLPWIERLDRSIYGYGTTTFVVRC